MASPFKKSIKVLLEKGCDFQIGVRKGRVLELRPEGYHVYWEEWTDPETGECHESAVSIYGYDAVVDDVEILRWDSDQSDTTPMTEHGAQNSYDHTME